MLTVEMPNSPDDNRQQAGPHDRQLYSLPSPLSAQSCTAATFKREICDSPGNYLSRWRVMLAQAMIHEGAPLKLVAERVGYASQAGFLRAFKSVLGVSPTVWRREVAAA